jgi:hypothetical protein
MTFSIKEVDKGMIIVSQALKKKYWSIKYKGVLVFAHSMWAILINEPVTI